MKHTVSCHQCGKIIERKKRQYNDERRSMKNQFCSLQCNGRFHDKKVKLDCGWCGKEILQLQNQLKKSKSGCAFCNKSCAASYNNTLRRKGRRSNCEKMLYELLMTEYPAIEFLPNDKTMLDGYEVDIGVPQLSLAIEWNGIVHFKPIYGNDKLLKVQKRDHEKQQIAQNKGVHLIVVPDLVSNEKYVKEAFQAIKRIFASFT